MRVGFGQQVLQPAALATGLACCMPTPMPPPTPPLHRVPPNPHCSGRSIKSLKWFFIVSCGLLLLIAAGMVSQGVIYFTDAGLFGTLFPYEVRSLVSPSICCLFGHVSGRHQTSSKDKSAAPAPAALSSHIIMPPTPL